MRCTTERLALSCFCCWVASTRLHLTTPGHTSTCIAKLMMIFQLLNRPSIICCKELAWAQCRPQATYIRRCTYENDMSPVLPMIDTFQGKWTKYVYNIAGCGSVVCAVGATSCLQHPAKSSVYRSGICSILENEVTGVVGPQGSPTAAAGSPSLRSPVPLP